MTPPPIAVPPVQEVPQEIDFDSLPDVGFPNWVKVAALAVVALVILSIIRLPSSLRASVAEARGEKMFEAKNYSAAIEAYKQAEAVFPDSDNVVIPLADCYLKAEMPLEAAHELNKIVGKPLSDEDYKRAGAIGDRLEKIADRLEKEGRQLTDEDFRKSKAARKGVEQ